jgi:hypothetical protein
MVVKLTLELLSLSYLRRLPQLTKQSKITEVEETGEEADLVIGIKETTEIVIAKGIVKKAQEQGMKNTETMKVLSKRLSLCLESMRETEMKIPR